LSLRRTLNPSRGAAGIAVIVDEHRSSLSTPNAELRHAAALRDALDARAGKGVPVSS
jgi:hypothetical protein